MPWFERQLARLHHVRTPCVIHARNRYGIPYLFHAYASSAENVLWIQLGEGDDAFAIGNRLSSALLRATAVSFFGMGMPYQYGLAYLRSLARELGPITLLISDAHQSVGFAEDALHPGRGFDGALRVILSGFSDLKPWRVLVERHEGTVLQEQDLAVAATEVKELLPLRPDGSRPTSAGAATCPDGAYECLLTTLRGEAADRPVRPVPAGVALPSSSSASSAMVLERLLQAERWQEAFEWAVREGSGQALDLIDAAGDAYFANGEVPRFVHYLRRLEEDAPHDPSITYWTFLAKASVGRLHEVEGRVARFIRDQEAPELQAAYASAVRPPDALSVAEAAVAAKRCPETLAALGFLRALNGDVSTGVEHLKEAFDGYKADRRFHKAVQVSNSIGSAYVQLGDFHRGIHWGRWSLDEIRRRGIREELLRLSTINLLAFTYLLVGEVEAGEELLRRTTVDIQGPLPSTLEGLVSTFGDYELVHERPRRAVTYYERLVEHLNSHLPGYATHHLVRGLLHVGRLDDAEGALEVARELASHDDEAEVANLAVARMLLDATRGTYDPALFEPLLAHPVVEADAVLRIELIASHLAHLFSTGQEARAREIADRFGPLLGRLGRSGWVLFAPPTTDVAYLSGLARQDAPTAPTMFVLGRRRLRDGGEETKISLRIAELLVVLALHPDGLTGESLLYEVYGESGLMSTLKATVSRARRIVPIGSLPYRFEKDLHVDLLELRKCLRSGEVREALELYKGPLLPESEAPGVRQARERIDEAVRQAVLHAGEWDLALRLARRFPDDLELWEEAGRLAPKNDPAYPLIRAQVRRIRGEWGL